MSSTLNSLAQELHALLLFRGLKLALAESCTGGLASATLTSQAGSSAYFMGSVVSYHRSVKHKILKVPMSLIEVMGEVSTPVAEGMARGVRDQLHSDWALSITGVAGPSGGTVEKPVGTVCFAVVGPGYMHSETKIFKSTLNRLDIQQQSVQHGFQLLYSALRGEI